MHAAECAVQLVVVSMLVLIACMPDEHEISGTSLCRSYEAVMLAVHLCLVRWLPVPARGMYLHKFATSLLAIP